MAEPTNSNPSPTPSPELIKGKGQTKVEATDVQNAKSETKALTAKEQKAKAEADQLKWDNWLRVAVAIIFAGITAYWLFTVGEILKAQNKEFCHSDAVLIALLTTTTLNVVGLLYCIANYLYPQKVKK